MEKGQKGLRKGLFRQVLGLLVILSLVAATSSFGALFPPGPWYQELTKPALTPPGWVFTPVWLTLYLMIALAGWLVWRKAPSPWHTAVVLWAAQLVLNAIWSWIFFGLQSPELALVDICLLLLLILGFILYAYPLSRSAALLFLPYAAWVGLAAYLNLGIVWLN